MWNLERFCGRVAVINDDGSQASYDQLAAACKKLELLVSERALIFCLCSNSMGSLIGYLSFVNRRAVPLLLPQHVDSTALAELIAVYQPKFVWLPDARREAVSGICVHSIHGYTLVQRNPDLTYPLHNQLALLLTTSGSTGSPKLVRLTYQNLHANTQSIIEYLGLDASERAITTLPMQYTYGLSIINTHLMVGASIILTDRSMFERKFWKLLEDYEATSFGGVPYTYEVLNKVMFFRRNLPSLRYMTQAGGKLLPELHKKFSQYARTNGKRFIVMYGASEATARMAYLPFERSFDKYGSMGIAIPGGKLGLVNEAGDRILHPGIVGELVYEGKNVTMGYAENGADLALGDERHGILYTGDMAKMDGDGYFYVVGRKKRFLKIFGNRVNLDEIERLLKTRYSWIECACAGKDDAMDIFINDSSIFDDVRKYLTERTKLNAAAFHIRYVSEIPKNESGKTQYKKLENYDD